MKSFIVNLKEGFFSDDEVDKINSSSNVLIQLFCGDLENLEEYVKKLNDVFKDKIIIGATTDGEIEGSNILENSVICVASIFEKTSLSASFDESIDEFEVGKNLIKNVLKENTKAIISFSTAIDFNIERFLKGVNEFLQDNVIFSGGVAGDNSNFKETYVVFKDKIIKRGAVAVSLNSDDLEVSNFYNFGWRGVGIGHIITKAKDNVIYEIDGISAVDFYKRYLGEEAAKELPKIGMIFPLIVKRNGKEVARAVLEKRNNALVLAGNVKEGEIVKIGIGDKEKILDLDAHFYFDVESFFIYSCTARKKFASDLIVEEIKPFSKIAPTCGFFTYGEFFSVGKALLFNHTMTVLGLSESKGKIVEVKSERIKKDELINNKVLISFINSISKDYERVNELLKEKLLIEKENIKNLENLYSKLISTLNEGVLIIDKNLYIEDVNDAFLKMAKCEKREICKENGPKHINAFLLDFSRKYKDKSFETFLLTKDALKEVLVNVSSLGDKYLVTISDISELKQKERELFEERKLSQMSEMLNMIAHQWRQPLNVISSIAIELELKATMGMLKNEDVIKKSRTIQEVVQKMSKVIDEFLNFTSNNKKGLVRISRLIKETLNLIKDELKNNGIDIEIEIKNDILFFSSKGDLIQILLNFLTNAKDILSKKDKDKKIWLRSYVKDNWIYIEVEDNGGGVSEEIKNRIFEPYFTTNRVKGRGLGLYISKKIAQKLGGDIFFENTKNGAKFVLKLPISRKSSGGGVDYMM